MKTRFITETINIAPTVSDVASGTIKDYVEIALPSDMDFVEGVAFYESKNADLLDYDIRVADNAVTHQDFTPRLDYLAIIAGTSIMNVPFNQRYKPFPMPCQGNKLKIGIKHNVAVVVGKVIQIKIVAKLIKQ